ncbi:SAM hydrolase/SAM-dependent halogenase family protein [Thermodesulforhabdus norvegica]|uniref:S-adenosyl-l-methionine hydroxide adenosyltransferase n=1 Tax=Thermodesulforhabdus norvegica TaxID=39841 RepID=A0A1I4SMP3_9BACT|nr:SAM-dependent chlorinase/fluorinase [Thermodesulforhabdus norvegica]SFM65702.1 hypothetical protein SAMN05660836_01054 [Thermodesulforhabdus norvegica]
MRRPLIALLTDFGTRDGYVAAMKAVILKGLDDVEFVDISHEVDPFRIESAAYVLYSVFDFFPSGTIFLCVVDPGVGTARKALAVEVGRKYLVGPDNGLFSWVLKSGGYRAFSLENVSLFRSSVSSTFHGRDVFAPVAAYLASGGQIDAVGTGCEPYIAEWTEVDRGVAEVKGQVIHIDRFGNLITNIRKDCLPEGVVKSSNFRVRVGDKAIESIVNTYGDVPEGALCALWGSYDHLEISVCCGNASETLSAGIGDRVFCRW